MSTSTEALGALQDSAVDDCETVDRNFLAVGFFVCTLSNSKLVVVAVVVFSLAQLDFITAQCCMCAANYKSQYISYFIPSVALSDRHESLNYTIHLRYEFVSGISL